MGYESDRRWSDRFVPEIKRILGEVLIAEAPAEEDMQRNTDLIVLRLDTVRVACRVRRYEYLERGFGNQFTIRTERPNGNVTELAKVLEGWGDYFFYGFADKQGTSFVQWICGDLGAFRVWYMRKLVNCAKGRFPHRTINNHDGSSRFAAFNIVDLPDRFVIASWPHLFWATP